MLRMVVLENYSKNGILKIETLENYLKIEVKIRLFKNPEFL